MTPGREGAGPGAVDRDAISRAVLRFSRALRSAGLAIGPARVVQAVTAAAEVGLGRRDDVYWTLHAALVSRGEDRALFHDAFELFWPRGDALPSGSDPLVPSPRGPSASSTERPIGRRLAEALRGGGKSRPGAAAEDRAAPEVQPEMQPGAAAAASASAAALSSSPDGSRLATKDFAQMSADEMREAEAIIDAMPLPPWEVRTRRFRPGARGDRLDVRAILRATARSGTGWMPLRWRAAETRPPVLVAIADVSGSMAPYSRTLLRFLHALTRRRRRVQSFTFATRLTHVTRQLRRRDARAALAAVARAVTDWEGGTRIGAALREFNLRWARRVLGQGAVVLLVTDGLDREDAAGLAEETDRLRRSCRRLVWLNPLLRYSHFEPRASGIRAMLPHVDAFLPVHDLVSLGQLADALSGIAAGAGRRRWRTQRAAATGARRFLRRTGARCLGGMPY